MQRLGTPVSPEQLTALEAYRDALWAENEKLNLTRHITNRLFASRDILDSQAFAAALQPGEDTLDVGTGGGVPGVILKILRPDVPVSLVDSIGKKAAAVRDIVRKLKLPIEVHHGRAEDLFRQGHTFDTLAFRAVARLDKILTAFKPHWGLFHRMLILKGPRWVDERGEARHKGLLRDVELRKACEFVNPDNGAESVLLELRLKRQDG